MSLTEQIEDNLAESLAESFSGAADEANDQEYVAKYDFDSAYQLKVAGLFLRDQVFARKVQALIKPDYFEDASVAILVDIGARYFSVYRTIPSKAILGREVVRAIKAGKIRESMKSDVVKALKKILAIKLTDRDYIAEDVAEFARHQAIMRAMMAATDLAAKGQYDRIADLVAKASRVGIKTTDRGYDYFEQIENRSAKRIDEINGILPPRGITTGIPKIDEILDARGWGKKELSLLMGGPKAGKSAGLLFFAKNAALAGHNTLYITLEMSDEIAAKRVDASISETEMKQLTNNYAAVEDAVKKANSRSNAKLMMVQMPGYSLTPNGLRAMVEDYAADGMRFELIVLDYLDLMAPDNPTTNPIENSKQIYVGTRAVGQEENIAILSATQTNRDGIKSLVATMENVSDDINKVRISDITISINSTEDERLRGEARLYFAAARNDRGGLTVHIKNDVERMIFIKQVLDIL